MSLERAYQAPEAAEHYQQRRWKERAHARHTDRRERAIVAQLLDRCAPLQSILDVPSGAGRFQPLLAARCGRYRGADASGSMLRAAPPAPGRVRASAERLPFRDAAVDLAFCFRLLHHLPTPPARASLLAELARVSRRWAIVSWYDRASLPAWRHRVLRRRRARFPISRQDFEAEAAAAGWRLAAQRYVARGFSEQVVALLERS